MTDCSICMEVDVWNYLRRLGDEMEGPPNKKGASLIVRRCVDYCIKRGVVEELAFGKG